MADNRDTRTDSDDLDDEALDRNKSGNFRMCCTGSSRTNVRPS